MGSRKSATLLFQNKSARRFICNLVKISSPANPTAEGVQDTDSSRKWKATLKEELKTCNNEDPESISIYRVPINMRQVKPNAYIPNIISIGPYHHGAPRLKEMERLKKKFFYRIFQPKCSSNVHEVDLDSVIDVLEELEEDARGHYADEVQLSKDKFIQMMLIDGCFIIELLRDQLEEKNKSKNGIPFIEKWMLPVLRRDLIMLENQLPLSILHKLFELTTSGKNLEVSLELLALQFFAPLVQRDLNSSTITKSCASNNEERTCSLCCEPASLSHKKALHFLDLFRSSILPRVATEAEENEMKIRATEEIIEEQEINKMYSVSELEKAGVMIEKGAKSCLPLNVHSEGRALIVPPIYIDDYRGTLVRNLVAFEQRHHACKPQVTEYIFFLDGLINTVEDVEVLQLKEVIQHSLGSHKDVAQLINNICKEVARETRGDSYLNNVLWDVNIYMNTAYAKVVAPPVHMYFGNWLVGIGTIVAFLAWYLPNNSLYGLRNADKNDSKAKDEYRNYLNKDSFPP